MDVSQMETEEDLLTCLHIKFYHPQQSSRGIYHQLPVGNRNKRPADEPLRLGRDRQTCTFVLDDPRVSRKQLALHAYRTPLSPDTLFAVQNLSQKGRMSVNGSALGFLERADLPDKALIRFGEYEMLVVRESGEAKGNFEVEFEVLPAPPSRETGAGVPSMTPIMDTGSCHCVTNSFPAELRVHGPLETDETLMYHS
ncbi:TRAF-interacting protein with FHA domain-containing protein A [Centroberyx affinis]|uniref:TRAF-interacting protein with FHA domain-containing protein A n=1 Tax=Centroberyx affinis TaxID=166261 RepID=UPI003A5C75D8